MRKDDEGLTPGEEKLLPEWGVAADDQIIALGLLVVAAFLAIFGWNTLVGDDLDAAVDTATAIAAPVTSGGADLPAPSSANPVTTIEEPDTEAVASTPSTSATTTTTPTTAPSTTLTPDSADVDDELVAIGAGIQAALEASGVLDADVEMNGTMATVRGEVPNEAARTAALDAALAVPGVTAIIDELTLPAPEVTIQELNALFELEPIQFASGSAEILADSFSTLDQAATVLADNDAAIDVQGYTDVSGPELTNLTLSQARADAVLEYLVGKGVAAENLTSTGYGETTEFGEGDSSEALAKNRRVRFELI